MAGKAAKGQRASTLVATGMVLAAGAIAWFGGQQERPAPAGPAEAATLPGREAPAAAPAAVRAVSNGGLPTRIVVPTAGIDAPVVEVGVVIEDGVARWETAWHAAGHHLDSAMPGQPGNMVISGHVSVADRRNLAVFATLNRVKAGDAVVVYAGERGYRYIVESIAVVDPDAVEVLRSDARATVTLVTCTPDLRHRLVVTGRLVGEVSPGDPA
ncbi:sortase [Tepidiforma sp.]|uniref:sortase n=1 Tax=Tepidiforma sp. TaxID=2682230 RepID=UPI00261B1CBD|nr:sortase [Tepidiforma sp.]MCX7616560.1 sortase [Tepidiforma sp.]